MPRGLYLIRHCESSAQHPDAPLTSIGRAQATALADRLASLPIDRIVSSPFLRAVQSIAPLAERLGLPVDVDARLAERILSTVELPHWKAALRACFDDPDLSFAGGESSRSATQRAVAAIEDIRAHAARVTAVVTHGKLLTLLLKNFDPRVGFAEWQALTNPDIFCLSCRPGGAHVQRLP
jgi:2,3-bisphosphoglycerate-dependent phosphoglycerate mutase